MGHASAFNRFEILLEAIRKLMHGSCLTTQCSPTYPWDLFSRGELIVVLIRGQKGWTTKKDQSTFNLQTSSILHCYLWSRSKVNSGYVDRFLSFLDRVSISSLPRECHVNQECILFGKLQRRYLSYGPAFSFYSLDLTRNQGRNECPVSAARSWYFMSGSRDNVHAFQIHTTDMKERRSVDLGRALNSEAGNCIHL